MLFSCSICLLVKRFIWINKCRVLRFGHQRTFIEVPYIFNLIIWDLDKNL